MRSNAEQAEATAACSRLAAEATAACSRLAAEATARNAEQMIAVQCSNRSGLYAEQMIYAIASASRHRG